jgi:hypothetical protein
MAESGKTGLDLENGPLSNQSHRVNASDFDRTLLQLVAGYGAIAQISSKSCGQRHQQDWFVS